MKSILASLKPLQLPFTYDYSNEMEAKATVLPTGLDSKTFPGRKITLALGYLPDTSTHYSLLMLVTGFDFALPVLFTFDKRGNAVDEGLLTVSLCGSGGVDSCESTTYLLNDFQFQLHSFMIPASWDSLGNKTSLPGERMELSCNGMILPGGKIEMGDTVWIKK